MESLYNILTHLSDGNINVFDGKIDTKHFGYDHGDGCGCGGDNYRFPRERIDYESDYIYKELYDGVEGPENILWLDLIYNWIEYGREK